MDNSLLEILTQTLPQVNPHLMEKEEFQYMVNNLSPGVSPGNDIFQYDYNTVNNVGSEMDFTSGSSSDYSMSESDITSESSFDDIIPEPEYTRVFPLENDIPGYSQLSVPGHTRFPVPAMSPQHEDQHLMGSEEFEGLLTNMLFGSPPPTHFFDGSSMYVFEQTRNSHLYPNINMNLDLSNDSIWEEEDTVIYSLDEDARPKEIWF